MHGKSRRASERTEAHIRRTPCSRTPRILQRTPHTRVQSACAKPPCASRTIRIPPPHVTCRLNINRHAVRTVPKSHTSAQAGHAADTPRIAHPRRTRFLSSDIAPRVRYPCPDRRPPECESGILTRKPLCVIIPKERTKAPLPGVRTIPMGYGVTATHETLTLALQVRVLLSQP